MGLPQWGARHLRMMSIEFLERGEKIPNLPYDSLGEFWGITFISSVMLGINAPWVIADIDRQDVVRTSSSSDRLSDECGSGTGHGRSEEGQGGMAQLLAVVAARS